MRINLIRVLLLALAILALSAASSAQVLVSVSFGPPALPVYTQPLCPGQGYVWTPGYWAWSPAGYYWVPGTWVLPPAIGLLWTPGYWAFNSGLYYWYPGYWGPVVGYYGGIDYGFGYPGTGYYGGYWRGRHFFYNEAVNRLNTRQVHYFYRGRAVERRAVNRVSFNGGPGGTHARPTFAQEALAREHHIGATAAQREHVRFARENRQSWASVNAGRPPIAATPKPGESRSHGAVAASRAGAPYRSPENHVARSNAAPVPGSRPEHRPAPSPNEVARNHAARPEISRPPSNSFRGKAAPAPERFPGGERQFRPQRGFPQERPNTQARSWNNEPFRREFTPAPQRFPGNERQFHPQFAPREMPNLQARAWNRQEAHPPGRAFGGEGWRHR